MMKLVSTVILIAALSLIATWYLPWWSLAIIAFVVCCIMQQSPGRSFLAAFLAIFLLWLVYGWWEDNANDHILAGRMAGVFGLPNHTLFLVAAALAGGVVAGIAGWAGGFVRRAWDDR